MKKDKLILDNSFYKTMFTIALPVLIQHVISIGLNLIDTIMIGKLGEDFLAAVGIANRVYFIFTILCFGLYSGSTIFVSQYWGKKDIESIKKILGIELFLGTIISIIFTIIVFLFPENIMQIFIKDIIVIKMGAEYLRIISFTFFFTAITFAFNYNSRSIHMLKKPTIINALALSINTILNYILIYGKFGAPSLGVKGAAYATLIARVIEFVLILIIIYNDKDNPLAGKISELMDWDLVTLKRVLKTSFPVIINEGTWALGTTIYYIAYGMLGPEAIAVIQVTYVISDFFQSVFFGLGSSCAVMIGNEIGKNNLDKAYYFGKQYIKITILLSVFISILLFLCKDFVIEFYNFEKSTTIMLSKALIVSVIYTTPKMLTYLIICGILRSGGDTKFCMYLEFICIWVIGVPIAFISVKLLNLPLHLVLAAVFSEEIFRLLIVYKRFTSKAWINNLVN